MMLVLSGDIFFLSGMLMVLFGFGSDGEGV